MADEPADSPIHDTYTDTYTQQIAAVLATNRAQQAVLKRRLAQLQADEEKLSGMLEPAHTPHHQQDTSPTAGEAQPSQPEPQGAGAASAAPAEAVGPQPRTEEASASPVEPAKAKRGTKKTAAKKTTARKAAPKKTAAAATASKEAAEPKLVDLLLLILDQRPGERHTALEITNELNRLYPHRARPVKNVRQSLESLMAQSRLERAKQGSTVFYSRSATPEPADQESTTPATPDTEDTEGSEAVEKVPATD